MSIFPYEKPLDLVLAKPDFHLRKGITPGHSAMKSKHTVAAFSGEARGIDTILPAILTTGYEYVQYHGWSKAI